MGVVWAWVSVHVGVFALVCHAGMSLGSQISVGTSYLQQESPLCWQPEGLPSFSDRKAEAPGIGRPAM